MSELIALDAFRSPGHSPGANRAALDALLAELDQAGLLTGRHRALGLSLQTTADAVDKGMRAEKVSVATTTLNKLLLEGIAQLPELRATDGADAYNTLDAIIASMVQDVMAGDYDDDTPDY